MKKYNEEGLIFEFNNKWTLPDFQAENGFVMFDKHPVYKALNKIGNYQTEDKKGELVSVRGPKAVDFVGVLDNKICFIEVKNYRKNTNISNIKIEQKATDIASKVKDSIATIIGGKYNCKEDTALWKQIVELLQGEENKIHVICWLEINIPNISTKKSKDILSRYSQKLKQKLNWLIESNGLLVLDRNSFYEKSLNERFHFDVDFEKTED